MSTITPQDLAENSGALLDRVEAGEQLVVVRGGRPVAELRPVTPARQTRRPFGLVAGAFAVPDDFDAPLPDDILRGFEGR
jgi:antitoxin (DNA-binding transcriptional repressor) of toxin-antitoxin stability system